MTGIGIRADLFVMSFSCATLEMANSATLPLRHALWQFVILDKTESFFRQDPE